MLQLITMYCPINSQIWDFNTGRTRGDEESGQSDLGYRGNDAGFLMSNFSAILQETDSATSKALGDMFGMNCSGTNEDVRLLNVCLPHHAYCNYIIHQIVISNLLHFYGYLL